MKVKQLIAELKKLPQDAEVIMSRDAEGNGFSPLDGFDIGTIHPDEVGQHRIDAFFSNSHTDEACGLEKGERETFVKAICIWPVN